MPKNETKMICPYPFSRTSFGHFLFIPCCSSWLNRDYFRLDHTGGFENSEAAIELRKSIIEGNFKYCNRDICQHPLTDINKVESIDESEYFLDQKSVQMIKENKFNENYPLTSIVVEADERCNLACPSCRSGHITKMPKEIKERLFGEFFKLKKMLTKVRKIKFNGFSEFFFSDYYLKIYKLLSKKIAPEIKDLSILTNGTLLNDESYRSLGTNRERLTEINVSIDAGDEETYKIVRGGSWKTLMKNLEFIKSLRETGKIKSFCIKFVVQEDNIGSIETFLRLGEKLNVDKIIFTDLLNWPSMKISYNEKAIHLPTHPRHEAYIELKKMAMKNPLVYW